MLPLNPGNRRLRKIGAGLEHDRKERAYEAGMKVTVILAGVNGISRNERNESAEAKLSDDST